MKAATLVRRASEKDLYDLAWFFERNDQLDGGMDGEALLISLVGTES